MKRAKKLFENQGIKIFGKKAEEELEVVFKDGKTEKDRRHCELFVKTIENYRNSKQYKQDRKKEALLNILLLFDPKAKITRFLSHRTRKISQN